METAMRPPEAIDHGQEAGMYNDTTTWLSEVLDGPMRTEFELRFDGEELYDEDGRALGPIFDDAIEDAKKLGPNLWFELRRRHLEREEYNIMIRMAKGEGPNTMIVESDFPPELWDAPEGVGGYNVKRKQTMQRVITRGEDGNLRLRSQSLDGSNREALEAIYTHFGIKPEAGELLGQRILVDTSPKEHEFLSGWLTGIYDHSLATQYGGEWYAGRKPASYENTYDFVRRQNDLLQAFIDMSHLESTDHTQLYNLAAAMKRRFENRHAPSLSNPTVLPEGVTMLPSPLAEMYWAGEQARASGETFDGCGISIGGGNGDTALSKQLAAAGYGNKAGMETKYKFDRKMHCVSCQAPPKEGEAKKMCGPCGICEPCDVQMRKQAASKENLVLAA